MNGNKLEVRVYPVKEQISNTLAYANAAINDMMAIRSIRVAEGKNGIFVSMPQTQDKSGMYHDIAYPLNTELRRELTDAVLKEYEKQVNLEPGERNYAKAPPEQVGRSADVKLDVRVFPLKEQKEDTLAFASAGLDGIMVISGIRVRENDKGLAVSMPQAQDKEGKFYDVAFPLSGELRGRISRDVLGVFKEKTAEQSQSISARISESKEEVAKLAQNAQPVMAMAKSSPGLGD